MRRNDLSSFLRGAAGHTELRTHTNRNLTIQLVNGSLTDNLRKETSGSSARAYRRGRWGFASIPDASEAALRDLVSQAATNAETLGAAKPFELPGDAGTHEKDFSTRRPRLSQKELTDFLRELDAHVARKYPKLTSRRVFLQGLDVEKTVSTSAGASVYTNVPNTHVGVALTLDRGGAPVELAEYSGGLGHFEDLFASPASMHEAIDATYARLEKKAGGIYAEAGTHDVILAPDLAGILAHEAIGHTVEADGVLAGSVAGDFLGKAVASELVSLTDFAHTAFGVTCPSPVFVDDEGTPAEDCAIIEKGVLKRFMHNKESAARLGMKPQGNARGFLFSDEPLIRMRNTAVLPGKSRLADMIASIDHGYLLQEPGNGQADATGEFMFLVRSGFEIRNGKLGRALLDTTISGRAFDMLKTVTAVSDDMRWISRGFCGKKQPMKVGMGGPAIRCRVNLGGR